VLSGDKHQPSLTLSGSQPNQPNSSLTNSLSSAMSSDSKTEHKGPVSKSGKRFNYGSSGRQYQVLYLIMDGVCRIFTAKILLFIFIL